ncbi:aminopeptidase N-like [Polyergus mexicanus]|uniref:aminopeptidase N-like n=1 Tax=Polyergus mexicanus TaxID=615972 RepID=UPI0038B695F2
MVFLKLLLNSCLTFIAAKAFLTDAHIELYEKHLLNLNNIISEHYNVQLTVPDIELNIFYSECNISIKILVPTQYLTLYSKSKCINDIIVTDNPPRFHVYNKEIIVYPISPGRYILNIKYDGIIDDNTKLTTFYKQKWWLIPTHFDVLGARQVFPCFYELLRATFNITIKHHRNYTALSNMAVEKLEINNVGMALTHFKTTPILPPYLITGIVTNFYRNSTKNMITNVWYRNCSAMHMVFAQRVIENVTLYLKTEWKHQRVISKVNHVAIPNFQDKNMVNLGLVLYREEDVIYDEKLDSAARKIDVVRVIGYKVLQEWVHNVYKLVWASKKSFWFNDCLIRFLGTYTVHKILPKYRIMDLFVIQSHHELLDFDTSYNTSTFNSFFEFPCCIKDYKNLVRSLNKSMDDKQLDTISVHKSELLNMIHIIDPWTKQKHYPTIIVKRDYDHPYSKMVLIGNYNPSHHYCIPLTYTIQKDLNFNDTVPRYWLNKTEPYLTDIKFGEDGWVIFNIQQIGYYRVNYDFDNWKKIASYLASKNYVKIHVLNRAQIIDDAFHFMITKQLDSSIFWNIIKYLEQETDFVAWYPMFKALEYMSSVFPLLGEETNKIKIRMQSILYKVLQELVYEEISNEEDFRKRLRQEAAKWACFFGDRICKDTANLNLKRHLANPQENKLLPWWKEWTYCNGLKFISHSHIISYENSTWWAVHRMGKEKFKTKVLEFLACPEHPDFIIDYLNMIGNNSETSIMLLKDFRDQDYINCFLLTIAKYARKDKVLNFILNKFKEIKPKKISRVVTLTVLINHLYSKEQLKQMNKFLTENFEKFRNYTIRKIQENLQGPLDNILEINAEMIRQMIKEEKQNKIIQSKLDIRSHQIESQIKYLDNLVL